MVDQIHDAPRKFIEVSNWWVGVKTKGVELIAISTQSFRNRVEVIGLKGANNRCYAFGGNPCSMTDKLACLHTQLHAVGRTRLLLFLTAKQHENADVAQLALRNELPCNTCLTEHLQLFIGWFFGFEIFRDSLPLHQPTEHRATGTPRSHPRELCQLQFGVEPLEHRMQAKSNCRKPRSRGSHSRRCWKRVAGTKEKMHPLPSFVVLVILFRNFASGTFQQFFQS